METRRNLIKQLGFFALLSPFYKNKFLLKIGQLFQTQENNAIDPDDWLLSNDISKIYSNNLVEPLIDGKVYYNDLKTTINELNEDGYLFLSAWRISPDTKLGASISSRMDWPFNLATRIKGLILSAIERGVKVRALLWKVPSVGSFNLPELHGEENTNMNNYINEKTQDISSLLDDRLPAGRFASHHQKFVLCGDSTSKVAYLGGLDIALDRWDTKMHSNFNRQKEHLDGWHDIQVKILGDAVDGIIRNFEERWTDSVLTQQETFLGARTAFPSIPSIPAISEANIVNYTQKVQILRTVPCQQADGITRSFPSNINNSNGEFTYKDGLMKAIKKAQYYIYIEDQYFWPCEIVDELETAIKERGVKVILLLTKNYDVPGLEPYHNYLRQSALDQLTNSNINLNNVFTYHLEYRNINNIIIPYVHSKLIIIDDIYVAIGSANISNRSFTTDTEIGVSILDSNVINECRIGEQTVMKCKFARDLRIKLWSEHLQSDAVDNPFNSNGYPLGFPTGSETIGHLKRHIVPTPQFCYPTIIPFLFMNSKTIC